MSRVRGAPYSRGPYSCCWSRRLLWPVKLPTSIGPTAGLVRSITTPWTRSSGWQMRIEWTSCRRTARLRGAVQPASSGRGYTGEAEGLDVLLRQLRPRVCFFGHHHACVDAEVSGGRCIGLNKVTMPGNLVAIGMAPGVRGWSLIGEYPVRGQVVGIAGAAGGGIVNRYNEVPGIENLVVAHEGPLSVEGVLRACC